MVLSRPDIITEITSNNIIFSPNVLEDQIGEASIDLRLGFTFTKISGFPGAKFSIPRAIKQFSNTGLWKSIILQEKDAHGHRECYSIGPGEFVLAQTYESVSIPRNLIAFVEGRSSYARFGLSMHQSAPWIQPGWTGNIILEISNMGENTIELTPFEERPCQLTFFRLSTPLRGTEAYGSRAGDIFQNQIGPFPKGED